MAARLSRLEDAIDYHFTTPALLEQAVTHRSHNAKHNERLEFLGDSVLNFVVASLLYKQFDRIDEGDLSRIRANLVKQSTLAEIAQKLNLSDFLRLGEGELKSGGFRRPSILSDALEAVFGAVYLDGGFEAAAYVISRQYEPILLTVDPKTLGKDPKTLLQEMLQGRRLDLPVYLVVATHGAAHSQVFDVECRIDKLDIVVQASGNSRRAAEQAAALQAIERVEAIEPLKTSRSARRRH
ncbi:ribonuclease III [Paenalcaligenes hermetiae]|uniref:Ribonuclease 3 n=1 Tax=Paenalcaligenes hermetiae TaxID=1157987 RepID=A0ABP9LW47_9BURK